MVMLRLKILLLRSINLPKWLQLKTSHLSLTMTMLFYVFMGAGDIQLYERSFEELLASLQTHM